MGDAREKWGRGGGRGRGLEVFNEVYSQISVLFCSLTPLYAAPLYMNTKQRVLDMKDRR